MSTTQTYPETDGTRSSAEIEAGIRNTRDRMDSTLEELGNRLSPRSLVNSAMDWWDKNSSSLPEGNGVKKTYRALTAHVRDNPVPSLLIGAGALWLMLKDDEAESKPRVASPKNTGKSLTDRGAYGYPSSLPSGAGTNDTETEDEPGIMDKIKEKAHDAKEAVMETVDKVKNKASAFADGASETGKMAHNLYDRGREAAHDLYDQGHDKAHHLYERSHNALSRTGHSLEHQYDRTMERAKEAVEEYPLAVGVAFAALGALVGVLLPTTRKEDELMGEKSDALMETVKEKGEELLEKGKAAAGELGDKLVDEASAHGITAEAAGEKLTELAGKTGEVIRKAAEQAGEAVKTPHLTA
ncbi:MAG: hypothetical protein JWM59_3429 [Verrucomicrobiales bacterium]|nr:hypothetical protein [Verrucomicrobiales bacterium]